MDTAKQWNTRTDQRWYIGTVLVSFALIGVTGAVAMWLWLRMAGPALMILGCSLIGALMMVLILKGQPSAQLHFENDELHIRHVDGKSYEVYAIPVSDFVCRQNFLERKFDVGRIRIKGTIFCFYGVQNYTEACRYIRESFLDF